MKDISESSQKLQDLIFDTLEHCVDLKRDEEEAPFVPFAVVTTDNEESSMRAFMGDNEAYGSHMFLKIINEENPAMIVYAYDGYLTINDERTDAILIKAYEKNDTEIFLVGQRYVAADKNASFQIINNPVFMGTDLLATEKIGNGIDEIKKKKPWWKF